MTSTSFYSQLVRTAAFQLSVCVLILSTGRAVAEDEAKPPVAKPSPTAEKIAKLAIDRTNQFRAEKQHEEKLGKKLPKHTTNEKLTQTAVIFAQF
ncbi:MAG: hypothetical protein SGJ20_04920, partial [Planctomycetota bacterium]|nr:hypothetical protein [Planctomycetota bacterium]